MRINAAELEQAAFLTLKKQMEAAAPLAPDGTLRADSSVPERTEYEQQIETLQDGKRTLYERYLMGEIDLNTYKAEKAACDELLLKTKNAYRTLPLSADAISVLMHQRRKTGSSEWVFPSPTGGPMSPDSVLHMLQRVLKRAGLPRIRFHDLRHLYVKHTTKKYFLQKQKSQTTNKW